MLRLIGTEWYMFELKDNNGKEILTVNTLVFVAEQGGLMQLLS